MGAEAIGAGLLGYAFRRIESAALREAQAVRSAVRAHELVYGAPGGE